MILAASASALAQSVVFNSHDAEKAVSPRCAVKNTDDPKDGTNATGKREQTNTSDAVIKETGPDGLGREMARTEVVGPAQPPAADIPPTVVITREVPSFSDRSVANVLKTVLNVDEQVRIDSNSMLRDDWRSFDKAIADKELLDPTDDPDPKAVPTRMFHWGKAIRQVMVMQLFQHSFALAAQEKTRRGLKGPFFSDYINSVKGLHGWDDGNRFFTNYVAHPMQGATTGFIFIQNHERAKRQKFGESKEYWIDRLKTFAWSAAWSTNWELGPISQASIGNVGLNGGMGYVDLVITPTVGTAWTITEEAIDRYVIRHHEGKGLKTKILMRTFLNPMRTMANLLRFKRPWYRDREYYTAYMGS